jgi:hypothetical protein
MVDPINRDKIIWDSIVSEEQYIFQELTTSLIGIGALFFAFGTVSIPYVRTLIALVGLGGSLTLWVHAFGASLDRDGSFLELARSEEGRSLLKRQRRTTRWRSGPRAHQVYAPVFRMATWFMGLVSAAWVIVIIVNDSEAAGWSPISSADGEFLTAHGPALLSLGAIVIGVLCYFWILRSAKLGRDQREKVTHDWPEPPETKES